MRLSSHAIGMLFLKEGHAYGHRKKYVQRMTANKGSDIVNVINCVSQNVGTSTIFSSAYEMDLNHCNVSRDVTLALRIRLLTTPLTSCLHLSL